ncbi:hypothetical protein RRF57_007634 [Xylaria bambusicola]|uniref:T6SS Phospholipase effector Tle1-like catalytic domain-containing protein n=1 Tax=Xylaria bambusicola TaxID=326684 RepID=A0AAN7UGG3_9PEZI
MSTSSSRKRIIVCCDGTWQNSDNGHNTSSDVKSKSNQVPSNFQIIYYQSGVGSKLGLVARLLGGAFGTGISEVRYSMSSTNESENIREAYAFICANYVDGDEIILLGFSRGAFTARSIGGMISDLGLLTRVGQEYFYPIFKDMQNWSNECYGILALEETTGKAPSSKFEPSRCTHEYVSLGFDLLDIELMITTYQFYNTHLSNKIQHGFHALALDEARGPSDGRKNRPRLTYAKFGSREAMRILVADGQIRVSLISHLRVRSRMMDQLSSVGCEFRPDALERAFETTMKYYTNQEPESISHRRKYRPPSWAEKSIYESNKPIRPWSLHYIQSATGPLYNLVGSVTRAPGMYKKINPKDGRPLSEFLEDTNERIHKSVRVRLACEGLGLNDSDVWHCPSLLQYWRPRRVSTQSFDPVSRTADWKTVSDTETATQQSGQAGSMANTETVLTEESLQMLSLDSSERWVWEYVGPEITAPTIRTIVEENLGPYEQKLLHLAAGKVHVSEYAEKQDVDKLKAFELRGFAKMRKRLRRRWHSKEAAAARHARKKKDKK